MNRRQRFSEHGWQLRGIRSMLLVAVLVGGAAFVYGLLVARYEIFPYAYIYQAYRWLTPEPETGSVTRVRTLHLVLNKRVIAPDFPLVGRGGGISRYKGFVVGVDAIGHFFYFDGNRIEPLGIAANLNRETAIEYIDQHADERTRRRVLETFRVFDLEIVPSGDSADLYLTHYYWDAKNVAKRTRVSRLHIQDFLDMQKGSTQYRAEDWEVVYECQPAIEFSDVDPSPFVTDHSGGRMVVGPDGGIYVSFGDQRFDGVSNPFVAPQEDGTCFGKIFRIDPETLQAQEIARGLRNPQGLTFDAEGQLWSSEHGPQGGDELNIIESGENYGWPYNTYGTSYDGRRNWPLSVEPGRHDQFTPPVYSWLPSVAPSAILQIGDQPEAWRGDLLMGSLKAGSLHRMRILDGRVVFEERILIGERIRDMVQLDDGRFILWTDTPRILELRPANKSEGLELPVPLTDMEKENEIDAALAACSACHALGPNETSLLAPSLWGVYDRPIGSTEFLGYSLALRNRNGKWTDDSLALYLEAPQSFASGTTMKTPLSMSDDTRQLLIGYLKRLK